MSSATGADDETELALQREIETNEAQQAQLSAQMARVRALVAAAEAKQQQAKTAAADAVPDLGTIANVKDLLHYESIIRANLEEAQAMANEALAAQWQATGDVCGSLQILAQKMEDVALLQRLMEDESKARAQLVTTALDELTTSAAAWGRDAGAAAMRAAFLSVATPEACIETESRMRMAVELEEDAMRNGLKMGETAARKAQQATEAAREFIHRLMTGPGEPTTLEEAESQEAEARNIIEGRAFRAFKRLHSFELPADEEVRERLFGEAETYLARLATSVIRAFVDGLQQPQSMYTKVKHAVAEELPEGKRLGVKILADVSVHGPPDPLRGHAELAKQKLFGLPQKLGAPEEEAVVIAVAAEQVWDKACAATHDVMVDETKASQRCQMQCLVA